MRQLIFVLILCAAQFSMAQEASPHEGKWTAKYTTANGNLAQANVVVQSHAGSWDRLGGSARADPCVFGASAIAVETASADELVFHVRKSQALAGCKDLKLLLKRVDDKTLQGHFDGGRAVTLTR